MQRISLLLCLLLCLAKLANSSMAIEPPCARPLTLGWTHWPPYQYIDTEKIFTGLDIDIMMAMAKDTGCQIEYLELPWKRILKMIASGKIDLILGASITDERKEYANFSNPYRKEEVSLFVRKGESKKYHLDSLKDILIYDFILGVYSGVHYGEQFNRLTKRFNFKSQVQFLGNNTNNMKLLVRGRFDGTLEETYTAGHQIKENNLTGKIERYPLSPINTGDISIMFSKKTISMNTINALNKSLSALKENGTIERILEKYTLAPTNSSNNNTE